MSKNLTFNSGIQFVEHVLPEPTEGAVPALKQSSRRLTDQATKLRAECDQAQATVSAATQQVADMAIAGKSAKAFGDVLAEAAHARFNIATLNEQLDIVRKADSILSRQLSTLKKSDPEWKQYLADCQHWRRRYDDALRAIQREYTANEIQPVSVQGWEQQKAAKLEAQRLNTERWQESFQDFADEMIFKFERETQEPSEDGTTKRLSRRRA